MKPTVRFLIPAITALMAFGCEKNESVDNEICARGKLIQLWCADLGDLAIVQIFSNATIGEDWTKNNKKYKNVVLAQINKDFIISTNWQNIVESTDSTFYFNYTVNAKKDVDMCKICCPPSSTIMINTILSSHCPATND